MESAVALTAYDLSNCTLGYANMYNTHPENHLMSTCFHPGDI